MPGLFFINTIMLAGLAALGVPVLIHLLLKRRSKKVVFSTVRFFRLQDEQSSRKRKLRHWLLLALRLLIVSLLVMAFARPYARQGGVAGKRQQRRVVFVLDRSASMLASGTDGSRWDQAKAKVDKIIAGLDSDDLVALVECASHANVLAGFSAPATAAQLVRDLPPALGASTLAEGVQQAVKLIGAKDGNADSSIYLVSDLQKSACRGLNTCPVPESVQFNLVTVGDYAAPNVSVVALNPGSGETRPSVTVASFSDEPLQGSIELSTDGRVFSTVPLALGPGVSTNLAFVSPALHPGWHDFKAALHCKDALEVDNARFACLQVPEPYQVLLAEPRANLKEFQQATFFIASALNPFMGTTNAGRGAFNLSVSAPDQLAAQLTAAPKSNAFSVVVIPGLHELPAGLGQALGSFVRGGGGLVLFLDEEMSANSYNAELGDLLPGKLGERDHAPEIGSPWRIAFYDTNTYAFATFRAPNSGDLRIPEFTGRRLWEVSEGAKRLAFFDDGVPLIVARDLGLGQVVVVNTSADTSWTDWPKHKTFVPFIHGLTRFAVQKNRLRLTQDQSEFITGDDLDFKNVGKEPTRPVALKLPNQKLIKLSSDSQGRLSNVPLDLPGVYSIIDRADKEIRRFAVNLPPQESNLEALRPNDFLQQLVRVRENPKETLAAGLFGSGKSQKEFWAALLLAALVLLLIEPFVANRTSL